MRKNGISETRIPLDLYQVEADIPQLKRIEMDRSDLDPILEDVISDHISKYGWIQSFGTLVLAVFGIVASIYSGDWNACQKKWFVCLSLLIGGCLFIIPLIIKSQKEYTRDIVRIIDENISCMQSYDMSRDDWDDAVEQKRLEANEKAKEAISSIKQQTKKANKKLKSRTRKKRRHP